MKLQCKFDNSRHCDTFLQFYGGTKAPHTECRVERLSKYSLGFVQKPHAIGDTVKGKCSRCIIQADADTGGNRGWKICALVVVYKGEFGVGAVQTPGLVVPAQTALIAVAFTADPPVGNSNVYFRSLPVHLPVAASPSYTVPAQHLR